MAAITCRTVLRRARSVYLCTCGVRFNSSFSLTRPKNTALLTSYQKCWPSDHQAATYYKKEGKKDDGPWGPKGKKVIALASALGLGMVGSFVYVFGQLQEDQKNLYENENTALAHIYRIRDRVRNTYDSFAEPSRDILLPDPLPEPYVQPKYTLVIELSDLLVHAEYVRDHGWRVQKRPGVAMFLRALAYPMFEIVIYSKEAGYTADPVVAKIDPDGEIMYRLYRDTTKYMDGTHVKDLSKLNRDITKVILLDVDEKASQLQPRNSLVLKKWEGDPHDIALIELITFFHQIASYGIEDVREVLDVYRNEDDPVAAFRRRQDALREQQEEMLRQQATQQQRRGMFGGFLGRR